MIKKNIFCIVLMFLITECADYKPLYSADKSNFNIGKIDYEGDDIIVGSGTSGRISNTSTLHPSEQELKQRIRKKIENRILGNEEY